MAEVTICCDFGAQENKLCHCFHCCPIYFPCIGLCNCYHSQYGISFSPRKFLFFLCCHVLLPPLILGNHWSVCVVSFCQQCCINGIIQFVAFETSFIHIIILQLSQSVVCINSLFLVIAGWYSFVISVSVCLSFYLFIYCKTFGLYSFFWLWIELLWTFLCKFLCGYVFSFL